MNVSRNQIQPVATTNASGSEPFRTDQTDAQAEFLHHLRRHIKNKICYYSHEPDTAELVKVEDHIGFVCHMWTLTDKRKLKKKFVPFRPNISCSGGPIGNIWRDYEFPQTPRMADIRGTTKASRELEHTRRKAQCEACHGLGTTRWGGTMPCRDMHHMCAGCRGTGSLVWSKVLRVKWSTIHSISSYNDCSLPPSKLERAAFSILFEDDIAWEQQAELEDFPSLKNCLKELPLEFQKCVDGQYMLKHIKKSNGMARIKVRILQVKIVRMMYSIDNLINKRDPEKGNIFELLVYGDNNDLAQSRTFEHDYPMNCCGCLGPKHACYSACNIL